MKKQIQEFINIALGETSALFMSQGIKATEIVMPTEQLANISDKLTNDIMAICREYALSCKPDIKEHTCRMNDGEWVCECFDTALKEWEENIKGKIN